MRNGKYVVLCVDDDPDVLMALRIILEKESYAMEEAPSGEEGVKKYQETKPDFILIDLMMEEVDAGANMARQLLALGNKAPVYMLSSVGQQLTVNIDPKELGVTGFFQKPVYPETLLLTLRLKLPR